MSKAKSGSGGGPNMAARNAAAAQVNERRLRPVYG